MSLFRCQEWWSITQDDNDECSPTAAWVGRLLSGRSLGDQILIGFFSGKCRIYDPYPIRDSGSSTYGPENLLLEIQLPHPILQVSVGSYGSVDVNVAILHPRSLSVYSVTEDDDDDDDDNNNKNKKIRFELAYQHPMTRSCYSMIHGSFGRVKDKDYICVQSLDGSITVFEQESFGFQRFLPNFLLPGPLIYVSRIDSFLCVASDYSLQCYKYEVLAIENQSVHPIWNIGIGEDILDIRENEFSSSSDKPSILVLLGIRTLFVILDTGITILIKKLDFNPICFLTYIRPTMLEDNYDCTIVVASDNKNLYVMENSTLKWVSQMHLVPSTIYRGSFKHGETEVLNGFLCSISSKGDVFISCLGTNPSLFSAPPASSSTTRIQYQDSDDTELQRLTKKIQSIMEESHGITDNPPELKTKLRLLSDSKSSVNNGEEYVSSFLTKVILELKPGHPLSRVKISFQIPDPWTLDKVTHFLPSLFQDTEIKVDVYLKDRFVPSDMTLSVVVSYMTLNYIPIIVKDEIRLPLRLLWKSRPPIKESDFKLTLTTIDDKSINQKNLIDLFPEFFYVSAESNGLGFEFITDIKDEDGNESRIIVSILLSKTSNRYRIQSNHFPSLWIFIEELVTRLKPFTGCKFQSTLPLREYFTEIDRHFETRSILKEIETRLAKESLQFRAIQRRLLSRFKDKTPIPLTNLDILMTGTYKRLKSTAEDAEAVKQRIRISSANVSSFTRLILRLVELSETVTYNDLTSALSPLTNHLNHLNQGWEETTDAALTFLLRGNSEEKNRGGVTPITLNTHKDTNRLKKHIQSVLERVRKGSTMEGVIEPMSILENSNDDDEYGNV